MTKKENFIALLIILFARTAFMFGDAIFSAQKNENNTTNKALAQWQVEQRLQTSDHSSANDFVPHLSNIKTQDEISQLDPKKAVVIHSPQSEVKDGKDDYSTF